MSENQRTPIMQQIIGTIAKVSGVAPEELNGKTSLYGDLSLDSLAMFEIVIDLEELYDLRISDEDIEHVKTIDDIASYVERHVRASGGQAAGDAHG
jgi:acyl carrier protein